MPLLSGAALCRICNPETNFTFPENNDPTGQGHSPRPDFCTLQVSLRFPSDSLSLRECHTLTRASRSPAVVLMSRKHRTQPDQDALSAAAHLSLPLLLYRWIWDLLLKCLYTLPALSSAEAIRVLGQLSSLRPWIPGLLSIVRRLFQNLLVTWAGLGPQTPSTGQPEPRRQCRSSLMALENRLSVLQMAACLGL